MHTVYLILLLLGSKQHPVTMTLARCYSTTELNRTLEGLPGTFPRDVRYEIRKEYVN